MSINSLSNTSSVSREPHINPQQKIKDPEGSEFSQRLKNVAQTKNVEQLKNVARKQFIEQVTSAEAQKNSAHGTDLAPKEVKLLAKIFAENFLNNMFRDKDDVSAKSFFKQQAFTTMLSESIATMLEESWQGYTKNKHNKIKNKKNFITQQSSNVANTKNIKSRNNVITE